LASEFGGNTARPATPMEDAADCASRHTDAVAVEQERRHIIQMGSRVGAEPLDQRQLLLICTRTLSPNLDASSRRSRRSEQLPTLTIAAHCAVGEAMALRNLLCWHLEVEELVEDCR
jgi:hypothetical protein